MKTRMLIAAVLALAALVGGRLRRRRRHDGGGGSRRPSGQGLDEALARRLLHAAGRLRRGHPRLPRHGRGQGRLVLESFGASGDQSRAVESGLAADVVAFSLAPDMTRLVKAGLVSDDWADNAHKGLVSKSVVSLIVRKGNPKGIHTWDDLLKPGIKVLTPNPFTSGAAKWNIMAAYGAKSDGGKNPQAGLAYLRELITKHVTVQDKSGREALQDFTVGQRRRPDLLRERGDHGPEEGPAGRLRHPRQDDPDREPDRRRLEVQAPRAGQGVPRLRALGHGPAEVRRLGLPAGRRDGAGEERREVPHSQRAVHHPRPRRLEQGQRRVLRSRQGLGGRDREGRGGLHCQVRQSQRVPPAALLA